MRLLTKTMTTLAVAASLSTFGAFARAQNLRVMGTTTGEGNAFFNGTSTFRGPAHLSDTTVNGRATVTGTTTLNGSASVNAPLTLNGPVQLGAMHFSGTLNNLGPLYMTSPDSTNIFPIGLQRTNEDGRYHSWQFWHMNRAYGQDSLQLYEYGADGTGATCTGNAKDGAICAARMTILKGGNVGFGTQAPAYKLDIAGDVRASGWLRSDVWSSQYGGGWWMGDSTYLRVLGDKTIWTNGLVAMQRGLSVGYWAAFPPVNGAVIAGSVGIGNSAPTQALDVNGRIRARQGTLVYVSACTNDLTLSPTCTRYEGDGGYASYSNTPAGRLVDL